MDKVSKVNCRACGRTHYGLQSHDGGLIVECPITGAWVETRTGKRVKTAEQGIAEYNAIVRAVENDQKKARKPRKKKNA